MPRMKMKVWLGLLIVHCCFRAGSSQCPPCARDEICNSATSTCDCDLTLYNRSASPPTPGLQCLSNSMSVNVSRCQLEKDHYDANGLHFIDLNCKGNEDRTTNTSMVTVSTELKDGACGSNLTSNGSHFIISNVLTIPALVLVNGIITKNNASYSFFCAYSLTMQAALLPPLIVSSMPKEVSGPDVAGDMEPDMNLFKDQEFGNPYIAYDTFPVDQSLNITVI